MKGIIAINYGDEGLDYITIEKDTSIDKAGKTLSMFYDSTEKVEELIERGNIKTLGRTIYHTCQPDYHYQPLEVPTVPDIPTLLEKLIPEHAIFAYVWDTDGKEWRVYSNIILPETAEFLGVEEGVPVDKLAWKEQSEKREEKQQTLQEAYNVHCWKDVIERCGGAVAVNLDGQWDYLDPEQSGKDNEEDEDEEEPECLAFFAIGNADFVRHCAAVPLWYHNQLDCYIIGKTFCGVAWEEECTCPTLR